MGCAVFAGCAGPAPQPEAPKVPGLDLYVEGAHAYDAGDLNRAQDLLQNAVTLNTNLTMARVLLGEIYRKNHDYQHATGQYQAAIRLDPYNSKNHYDLALAYQFLDRLEEAAAEYLKALSLSPRDINANINLGLVYLSLGQTNDAIAQLRHATTIDANSAAAFCDLGVACDASGQLVQAELAYQRAIEIDPKQSIALVNLGKNLLRQGRGAEAATILKTALTLVDTATVRKHYGDALLLTNQQDAAIVQYNMALKEDARYWPAMNQLGWTLLGQYQAGMTLDEDLRAKAVEFWRQSLAIRPDQPIVRNWVNQWDQNGRLTP